MKKKIIIPVFMVIIFFTGTSFQNDFFEIAKQIEIFTTLFKELNMSYVDETNPGDLMDTAIKNMLKDLDPYTNFLNEQDVEAARINNTGDYIGIGAKVRTLKDKLVIVEPYKDYPTDNAGLKAGDEIIKVGNAMVVNQKDDAGNLLKGSPGTAVEVTFIRQGEQKTATIKRAEVEINAVPHFSMIDNKTGYIVLTQFNNKAEELGLEALNVNIYSETLSDNIELNDVGYLMAMTANSDINKYTINKFSKQFGENGSFRLVTKEEMLDDTNNPTEGLFSHTDDFLRLTEVARKNAVIHEALIKDKDHYDKLIEITNKDYDIVPLFVKDEEGELHIISSYNKDIKEVQKGFKLVYLGKPLETVV